LHFIFISETKIIMKINEIIGYLATLAPPVYQESYDNAGLIVGSGDTEATGALICLDSIESVIDEAIEHGVNLVIAHHPIVFSGLKRFNGNSYIERVVMKAIKHDIAIYAAHTNLDNVHTGVNAKIAEKLGLQQTRILVPKKGLLRKLVVFVPKNNAADVRKAIFDAGAGSISDYDECSFNLEGTGTFRPSEEAKPFSGESGKQNVEEELRIEVIYNAYQERKIISAMIGAHPYEEVAHDIYALENKHQRVGSGMIGELPQAMPVMEFLNHVKTAMKTDCIRYTDPVKKEVKRIAICGGSGSFLLGNALANKADVFITGDYKYHQFFDADGKIVIADIGHYESEQFTIELIGDLLMKKFPTFAVRFTEISTNPINYI
jgi:dinuclear metal center YbgI/SA1388 family protein